MLIVKKNILISETKKW